MAKVLGTLRQEHRDMEKLLLALERQLQAFEVGLMVDYAIVEDVVDYSFAYPDLCHHPVEDLIYEKVKQRSPGAFGGRIDLAAEHKRLATLTERFSSLVKAALRETPARPRPATLTAKFSSLLKGVLQESPVPRNWFKKAARDYVDFTRHHMDREERYFFPVAENVLQAPDWAEIEARIADTEDPLFSSSAQNRFRRLRDEVLAWDDGRPAAAATRTKSG